MSLLSEDSIAQTVSDTLGVIQRIQRWQVRNLSVACESHVTRDPVRSEDFGSHTIEEQERDQALVDATNKEEDVLLDELDERLCMLWDLSAMEDAAAALVDLQLVGVLVGLSQTMPSRCIETAVGILANMVCHSSVISRDAFTSTLVAPMTTYLLDSADPFVLIEVMRFLNSAVAVRSGDADDNSPVDPEPDDSPQKDAERNHHRWISELTASAHVSEQLSFIIANSLNRDLVCAALTLVEALLFHSESLCTKRLLDAIIDATDHQSFDATCEKGIDCLSQYASSDVGVQLLVDNRGVSALVTRVLAECTSSFHVVAEDTIDAARDLQALLRVNKPLDSSHS